LADAKLAREALLDEPFSRGERSVQDALVDVGRDLFRERDWADEWR